MRRAAFAALLAFAGLALGVTGQAPHADVRFFAQAMPALSLTTAALKAALTLKYLSSGGRGIEAAYAPSDGGATWFALQDPVTDNFIAEISVRAAFSEALGIFASGEAWIGDTPGAAATFGLEYRFSTPSR